MKIVKKKSGRAPRRGGLGAQEGVIISVATDFHQSKNFQSMKNQFSFHCKKGHQLTLNEFHGISKEHFFVDMKS